MTIKEAQELVEAWNEKHSVRASDLTGVALLTEKVGELARAVANKHGEPHRNTGETPLSDEIAEIFWQLISLSSQAGIDLTDALIDNLEKKNNTK